MKQENSACEITSFANFNKTGRYTAKEPGSISSLFLFFLPGITMSSYMPVVEVDFLLLLPSPSNFEICIALITVNLHWETVNMKRIFS